jgi:transcriptional regulator GlxA family with amidase domain
MSRVVLSFICAVLASCVPAVAAAQAAPHQKTRNVAIVIWNGAEVLDWAGPSEVFASAAHQGAIGDAEPFHVYTVSRTRDAIVSQGFVDVIPDYDIDHAPKPDIVVFPGGGTGSVLNDAEFLAWATRTAREAEIALSVCTGAFVLGAAGLLDDNDVTTWYAATRGLAQRFPAARVHEGRRFIDNGQVVTTAGVSAGIDGALHVVARLLGRDVAARTAEYMQYLWAPQSYLSRQYSWLNPSADSFGRAVQVAQAQAQAGDTKEAVASYRALLDDHPQEYGVWATLGQLHYQAGEYAEAMQAYGKAAAAPSGRIRALYNAACSAALASQADRAFDYLQQAVAAGFDDVALLDRDGDLDALRQDARYGALRAEMQQQADTAVR